MEAKNLNLDDMIRFLSVFYCCIVCDMDRNNNWRGEKITYTAPMHMYIHTVHMIKVEGNNYSVFLTNYYFESGQE